MKREFTIDPQPGRREFVMDVALEPVNFGFLTVRTTPNSDATLIIRDARGPSSDGKIWTKKTPFQDEKIPSGVYNIRLVNELLGMEKTVTVQVHEGRSIVVDERLEIRH